jgi:hypothetical protein
MSLVQAAIRTCVVEAIKGRTRFEDNVLDSEIGAFSQTENGQFSVNQDKPFIAVYTESASGQLQEQPETLLSNGRVTLVLELGVTNLMDLGQEDPETGVALYDVGIPVTDQNQELLLNVVVRQIKNCLMDHANPWTVLLRGFVTAFVDFEQIRASQDKGVKLAAHQLKITCACINDPPCKTPLTETNPFAKFLAAADASSDGAVKGVANMLRATLDEDVAHSTIAPQAAQVLTDKHVGEGGAISQVTIESDVGEPHVEDFS